MITRRGFLSALCALPFVGKFMSKPESLPWSIPLVMKPMGEVWYAGATPFYPTPIPVPFATMPSNITDMIMVDGHLVVMCENGCAYVISEDGTSREIKRPPSHP